MNFVSTILSRAAHKKGGSLRILTAPTHEAYETNLCRTGHTFYAISGPHIKQWKTEYRPLPSNYIILKDNQVPREVTFDLALSHQKFGQFQALAPLAAKLHLPLVSLEHTLPIESWTSTRLAQLKAMRGDVNLFISEHSKLRWGWAAHEAITLPHGIDTEFFKPAGERQARILAVANDYVNRDYFLNFQLFQHVVEGLPTTLLGDNPGLSQPARSVFELREAYQSHSIFLNTSRWSPVPMSLMEAASCGCAIVSTSNCMIPEVFTHGKDACLTNDPKEMKSIVQELLKNPEECCRLGAAARETIISKFGLDQFVCNWNNVFEEAVSLPYKGF